MITCEEVMERMQYVSLHKEAFYEDDVKELLVVPVLCLVHGHDLWRRIFRDGPDARSNERRWDLQIVKKPADTPKQGCSDVFECKRASDELRMRNHFGSFVRMKEAVRNVNGSGDPFLQVYLCKNSGLFVRGAHMWLTNGIKWILFSDAFFNKWQNREGNLEVVDFGGILNETCAESWMKKFYRLKELLLKADE